MKPPAASVRCGRQVLRISEDTPLTETPQPCGAFLVDVEVETADGIHLETACPHCDGPLELVNVVQQIYRRKGAA